MRLVRIVMLALVAWLSGGAYTLEAGTAAKPNLLFIYADDLSYDALHWMGHAIVETPHLDRLAASGLTFTQAHNQGSWVGAVCVASRTMLNTGRFVWRASRLDTLAAQDKERSAGRFWSQYLARAGYETYMTGKWHLKTDPARLFGTVTHVRAGMPKDTPECYTRPIEGQPDPWNPTDVSRGGYWDGGKHWSEVLADDAVGYIEQAATRPAPFFMYLAFNAPHDPRQSPQSYLDKYPLERIAVPKNFLPEYPFKDSIGCGPDLRDERLAPFPRTPHAVKVHRREYYALITHLDAQIGRILAALDKSGKANNTYIFFTADQGLAVGHHGLFGKQNLYDHSVRVPLVVAGPGVSPGGKTDAPVYLQDIMPTTLELAGIPKPEHVQFTSLLPLVRGAASDGPYQAIYGGYLNLQRSVKADGYKLILYPAIKRFRLYRVERDPEEMHDLAAEPSALPVARRLFGQLLALQGAMGDGLELEPLYPQLAD